MKKNKTTPAARYTPFVEWSDEDQCYIGHCPELFLGGVHGSDRAAVYAELCELIDEWIEILKTDGRELPPALAGKDYSGKFVMRIDPRLHKLLALRARAEGDSLNAYCAKKLAAPVAG